MKDYKSIIRNNRRSIAILDGSETPQDLISLSNDEACIRVFSFTSSII